MASSQRLYCLCVFINFCPFFLLQGIYLSIYLSIYLFMYYKMDIVTFYYFFYFSINIYFFLPNYESTVCKTICLSIYLLCVCMRRFFILSIHLICKGYIYNFLCFLVFVYHFISFCLISGRFPSTEFSFIRKNIKIFYSFLAFFINIFVCHHESTVGITIYLSLLRRHLIIKRIYTTF